MDDLRALVLVGTLFNPMQIFSHCCSRGVRRVRLGESGLLSQQMRPVLQREESQGQPEETLVVRMRSGAPVQVQMRHLL